MSKLQADLNMLTDLIYYDKIDPDTLIVVTTSIVDSLNEIEKRDSILDPTKGIVVQSVRSVRE